MFIWTIVSDLEIMKMARIWKSKHVSDQRFFRVDVRQILLLGKQKKNEEIKEFL